MLKNYKSIVYNNDFINCLTVICCVKILEMKRNDSIEKRNSPYYKVPPQKIYLLTI